LEDIHAKQIAAIDFFTVPTLTFRNLYCFIILLHDRRQVIHFNVTAHPTAEWTARQIIEAFPEDSAHAICSGIEIKFTGKNVDCE
jgi:putative transposase